jgi:hypothetical protein
MACKNHEVDRLPSVQRDIEQKGQLVMLVTKDGSLTYHMGDEGSLQMKTIQNPPVSNIKYLLSSAKSNVERKLQTFTVLIILEGNEENTTYKSTVQALQELKIGKFKVINASK